VFAVPPLAPTSLAATLAGTVSSPRVDLSWIDNSKKEAQFTLVRSTNATFTAGLTSFNVVNPIVAAPSGVTFQDKTVAKNGSYWYKVSAIGKPIGDVLTAGFPTMSANSVSNTAFVQVGTASTTPAAPTSLTAVLSGTQVNLTWRDNATNETGFQIQRCTGVGCGSVLTNFVQIGTRLPLTGTGTATYVDGTVVTGNMYSYRVRAVNGTTLLSAFSNIAANVSDPAIPVAPTSFTVSVGTVPAPNTATLNWLSTTNPTSFTILRASNATFTKGLNTTTVDGTLRTATQTLSAKSTYYYRIRANNSSGGSSAWTNASPFPVSIP
jgi:hypothetical protein